MNKTEIHIKPTKVLGFDGYQMKVGTVKVTYRSINDLLLDIARTYEPPSTLIHGGSVPCNGIPTSPQKRGKKGGKRGFNKFVLELLEGKSPIKCKEVCFDGHGAGDTRPLKSYSAALRNLEKAGKVKSNKNVRPYRWSLAN